MGEVLGSIVKFVLAFLIIPTVVAVLVVFEKHLHAYPNNVGQLFNVGAVSYLISFLFVHKFNVVFELGHKISLSLMKIFSPLDKILARFIPFFAFLLIILLVITNRVVQIHSWDHYFMYFIGFFLSMHFIHTASDLQEVDRMPIKPSYLFWMGLIIIIVLCLSVLLLDLVAQRFSFPEFYHQALNVAQENYKFIIGWRQ